MVLKPDQERVKTLLQDTITLLCRNGLNYKSEFNVSALIGITLDKDEVFLVDIRETVKNNTKEDDESGEENGATNDNDVGSPAPKKRKHRRKRSHSAMSDGESATSDSVPGTPSSRIKPEDEDSSDAIIIKDEPGDYDQNSYGGQNDILGDLAQQGQLYAAPSSLPGPSTWDPSSQQAVSSLSSHQSASASIAASSQIAPQQKHEKGKVFPLTLKLAGLEAVKKFKFKSKAGSSLPPTAEDYDAEGEEMEFDHNNNNDDDPTQSSAVGPGRRKAIKNLQCAYCYKRYSHAGFLASHEKTHHRHSHTHFCDHCQGAEVQPRAVTQGGGKAKYKRIDQCSFCRKMFVTKKCLEIHVERCVPRRVQEAGLMLGWEAKALHRMKLFYKGRDLRPYLQGLRDKGEKDVVRDMDKIEPVGSGSDGSVLSDSEGGSEDYGPNARVIAVVPSAVMEQGAEQLPVLNQVTYEEETEIVDAKGTNRDSSQ